MPFFNRLIQVLMRLALGIFAAVALLSLLALGLVMLLLALLRGSGQVLSRQRLEQALYGFDEVLDSNALEVHMHHLRRKLGEGLVKTVRGVGYFVPVPESQGGA